MAFFGKAGFGFQLIFRDEASSQMRRAWATLRQGQGAALSVEQQAARMSMGLQRAGIAAVALGGGIAAGLGVAVKSAIDYNAQLRTVGIISGLSNEATKRLGREFDDLTATLPLSSFELAEVAQVAAQLGVTFGKTEDEAVEAIKAIAFQSAILGKAVGVSAAEASAAIGRLSALFGLEAVEAAKGFANTITFVRNTSTASAPFITEVGLRAGAAGKRFGFAGAQVLALAGQLNKVIPQAQSAGSGLTFVFDAILSRASDFAKFIGQSEAQFKALIRATPGEALIQVVTALGELNQFEQIKVFKQLGIGGRFAQRAMVGLIAANNEVVNGQSKLQAVLSQTTQIFEESTVALDAQTQQLKETSGKIAVLVGNIRNLSKAIGDELLPVLDPILDIFNEISARLVKMDPFWKKAIAFGGAFASAILLIGGAILLALPMIASIGAAMTGMGLTLAAVGIIAIKVIAIIALIALSVVAFIKLWKTNFGSFKDIFLDAIQPLRETFGKLIDEFKTLFDVLGFAFSPLDGAKEGGWELAEIFRFVFSFIAAGFKIAVLPLRALLWVIKIIVIAIQGIVLAIRTVVQIGYFMNEAFGAFGTALMEVFTAPEKAIMKLIMRLKELLPNLGVVGDLLMGIGGFFAGKSKVAPARPAFPLTGVPPPAAARAATRGIPSGAGPAGSPAVAGAMVPGITNEVNVTVNEGRKTNLGSEQKRAKSKHRDTTFPPETAPVPVG